MNLSKIIFVRKTFRYLQKNQDKVEIFIFDDYDKKIDSKAFERIKKYQSKLESIKM